MRMRERRSSEPKPEPEPGGPAPEATQEPAEESRRLDIQGLRAVAVILVVAFHAGLPVQGGFIGVDVFLVISGFVITAMLLRELERPGHGTIRLRHFYARRIKRLLPALAVLTTVVAALSVFLGSSFGSQQTTAETGLGATYLSANVVIYRNSIGYFSPDAETNPLLHTWTLSVEEQVYLVFPTLLLGSWIVGRRLRRRRAGTAPTHASKRGAFGMLAVVAIASFAFCLLVSYGRSSSPPALAFYSSLARVWEFAIGAALALAAARLRSIPGWLAAVLGVAGTLAIGIGAFTISGERPYPGLAVLVPVLGAAAVITAGFRPKGWVSRSLSVKPMTKIGDMSYAWYLWHWPLIVFGAVLWPASGGTLAAIGLASLIPAWLSTSFLENPIRRSKAIRGGKVVALAVVCTLVPTAACLGLAAGARTSWGNEAVAEMKEQVTAEHAPETNACDDAATQGSSIDDEDCQWNRYSKGPHVYLVGNSVAAMYSEALIGATRNLDFPLTIDTSHGCFSAGQADRRDCTDNFEGTIAKLARQTPGIVVISSTWDLGTYGGDDSGKTGNTPREKAGFLKESLSAAILEMQESGHHVLLVLPTPRFFHGPTSGSYLPEPDHTLSRQEAHDSLWRPTDCSAMVAQNDTAACGATVLERDVEEAQWRTMAALEEVAEETDTTTLNLRSRYCTNGVCRTNIGGRWMFEDGVHITVNESQALGPIFSQVLRQMERRFWGDIDEQKPGQGGGQGDERGGGGQGDERGGGGQGDERGGGGQGDERGGGGQGGKAGGSGGGA